MNGTCSALAARFRAAIADLQRVSDRANHLARRALSTGGDGYWDGAALNLHGVRIVYSFNLRPSRLPEPAEILPGCLQLAGAELRRCAGLLDRMARSHDNSPDR